MIGPHLKARLRTALTALGDTFWLLPGAMVLGGILLGIGLVAVDRSGAVPQWLIASPWLYSGGGTGARTLLGAVASSTIGVAGTVFSITIAALSLAAGQMGPRLLRNFTRDRGNQLTLGAFLGTFSYALMVLRSVRTHSEGEFVPHLSLSIGILLAFVCVGTLVFFVGHMAGRINVDTVINLVSEDVRRAIARLMHDAPQPAAPSDAMWHTATPVSDPRRGYLQQLDEASLAAWAAAHGTALRLLVRQGDYVFPGAAIALMTPPVEGTAAAIRSATAVRGERVSADDLEFAVRQLVEVGVRALSPGINDPHTAMSVLDRLGAALCDAAPRHLATGVSLHDGHAVLVTPAIGYGGLVDSHVPHAAAERRGQHGGAGPPAGRADRRRGPRARPVPPGRAAASCRPRAGRRRARRVHPIRPRGRACPSSPVRGGAPARAARHPAPRRARLRWSC